MTTNYRNLLKLILPVVLVGSVSNLEAGGLRLPDQDAFATGRGEAFAATADNPSAIYYNPAGIAQLNGNNFRMGLYGIYLNPNFTPPGGGNEFYNQDKLHGIPQFFYTYGHENLPVSFGLGVYSPFGLSSRWPQDTGFRSIAIEGSLTYVTINPVIALKLDHNFSIAAGVMVNYVDVYLQQGLTGVPNNDSFAFRGDGWDAGYNLGLLWQPYEQVSLGINFRSKTSVTLKGHTQSEFDNVQPNTSSPASADFPFPLNAVFGISYRPTPAWNLEFNADYTDWSTLGTVTVHQTTPPPIVPYPNVPLTFDWQSSWFYEFGATRYFPSGWHVSGGYIYNENSVPDAHYSPLVADLNKHFFSVGVGYKAARFDFDVAYQFGYGPTRTVTGSAPSVAGQTADGQYQFFSQALAASVGIHF